MDSVRVRTDKRFAEEPRFIASLNIQVVRFVHLEWNTRVASSICNEIGN